MINKIFRRDILEYILGVAFALLVLFGAANYVFQNIFSVGQAVKDREIQSLDSFELNWLIPVTSLVMGMDNWKLSKYDEQVLMRLQENQIILPVRNRETILTANAALTSFSLDSGEINWETEIPWNIRFVGQNDKHIFVINDMFDNREPREEITQKSINYCVSNSCSHIKITAYDIQSGEERWAIFYANINYVSRLFINDDIVSVTGYDRHGSWYEEVSLNAQTGEALPEFQDPASYVGTSDSYETIITNLGFDLSDIVSDFADNGDYIFFLTESDATLWAIDKKSSQIAGQVQFNRVPFLPITKWSYQRKGFPIAVSDNTVVVYLGDSEQLFTFDFTHPE